jgi:hypothetical protein
MPRRRKKAKVNGQNIALRWHGSVEHDDEHVDADLEAGTLPRSISVENDDEDETVSEAEVENDTTNNMLRYDITSNHVPRGPRGKYSGKSERTLRRKRSELKKALTGIAPITNTFAKQQQTNKTLPLSPPLQSSLPASPLLSLRAQSSLPLSPPGINGLLRKKTGVSV